MSHASENFAFFVYFLDFFAVSNDVYVTSFIANSLSLSSEFSMSKLSGNKNDKHGLAAKANFHYYFLSQTLQVPNINKS